MYTAKYCRTAVPGTSTRLVDFFLMRRGHHQGYQVSELLRYLVGVGKNRPPYIHHSSTEAEPTPCVCLIKVCRCRCWRPSQHWPPSMAILKPPCVVFP